MLFLIFKYYVGFLENRDVKEVSQRETWRKNSPVGGSAKCPGGHWTARTSVWLEEKRRRSGEELRNVIRCSIMKDFKHQGKNTKVKTSNVSFSLRKVEDH